MKINIHYYNHNTYNNRAISFTYFLIVMDCLYYCMYCDYNNEYLFSLTNYKIESNTLCNIPMNRSNTLFSDDEEFNLETSINRVEKKREIWNQLSIEFAQFLILN